MADEMPSFEEILSALGEPWESTAKADPRLFDLVESGVALGQEGLEHLALEMLLSPGKALVVATLLGFVSGFQIAGQLHAGDVALDPEGMREFCSIESVMKALRESSVGVAYDQLNEAPMTWGLHVMPDADRASMNEHVTAGCPCSRADDCLPHGWAGGRDRDDKPLTPRICADHDHYGIDRTKRAPVV